MRILGKKQKNDNKKLKMKSAFLITNHFFPVSPRMLCAEKIVWIERRKPRKTPNTFLKKFSGYYLYYDPILFDYINSI